MPTRACPRTVILLTLVVGWMVACQQPTERLFHYSSDASSRSGLVALEDGVLLGNEAGALVRLGRNGEPVWRVDLGREVAARPAVAGDGVLAGTVVGDLVHLALADGKERWRLTGQPPVLTPLVADAASLYVVAPDGAVRAHALDSGQVRWRRPAPKAEESHLDTGRAVAVLSQARVPVLGGVENMAYLACPHCGERTPVHLPAPADRTIWALGVERLASVPFRADAVVTPGDVAPVADAVEARMGT